METKEKDIAHDAATERLHLEREALKHFRVIVGAIKSHFRSVEAATGVSGSQLWALSAINRNPGMRVSALAETMSIHHSTASNLLDKLEEKQLIRRERKDTDQRAVGLYVTEKGAAITTGAPYPPEGVVPDALRYLPDETLNQLVGNLADLINAMRFKDRSTSFTPLADL